MSAAEADHITSVQTKNPNNVFDKKIFRLAIKVLNKNDERLAKQAPKAKNKTVKKQAALG